MPRGGRRVGAGRPKGIPNVRSVQDRLDIALAFEDTFRDGKSPSFHITRILLSRALKGDTTAAIHLDERYHGRVKYTVEMEGNPDKPVEQKVFTATLASGAPALTAPAAVLGVEGGGNGHVARPEAACALPTAGAQSRRAGGRSRPKNGEAG